MHVKLGPQRSSGFLTAQSRGFPPRRQNDNLVQQLLSGLKRRLQEARESRELPKAKQISLAALGSVLGTLLRICHS
jgi:hypothetical protein